MFYKKTTRVTKVVHLPQPVRHRTKTRTHCFLLPKCNGPYWVQHHNGQQMKPNHISDRHSRNLQSRNSIQTKTRQQFNWDQAFWVPIYSQCWTNAIQVGTQHDTWVWWTCSVCQQIWTALSVKQERVVTFLYAYLRKKNITKWLIFFPN